MVPSNNDWSWKPRRKYFFFSNTFCERTLHNSLKSRMMSITTKYIRLNQIFSFQKMALPLPLELSKENHFDVFGTSVQTTAYVTAKTLTKEDEHEISEMFKNMNMRYNAGDNLNLKVNRPTIKGTYAAKCRMFFRKRCSKSYQVNFFWDLYEKKVVTSISSGRGRVVKASD